MKPRSNTSEEPGMSVSVAASSPPVQDSAAAMVNLRIRQSSMRPRAAAFSSCSVISATIPMGKNSILPWQPYGGGCERRHAFAASDESELLAGGRLDGHTRHIDAGDLGDARAHDVAMRADAGRLTDHIDVEMGDTAAARPQALDREGKEPIRGSAAPLRITRRKVHPDVAFRERPQNGVDQGMQDHVSVRMAGQALLVRDAHPAQRDMIASRK